MDWKKLCNSQTINCTLCRGIKYCTNTIITEHVQKKKALLWVKNSNFTDRWCYQIWQIHKIRLTWEDIVGPARTHAQTHTLGPGLPTVLHTRCPLALRVRMSQGSRPSTCLSADSSQRPEHQKHIQWEFCNQFSAGKLFFRYRHKMIGHIAIKIISLVIAEALLSVWIRMRCLRTGTKWELRASIISQVCKVISLLSFRRFMT